jgi:hypothetical protein
MTQPKPLREFNRTDKQTGTRPAFLTDGDFKDPRSEALYWKIPDEGVLVGWAPDQTWPVRSGDFVGFNKFDRDHVSRAIAIVTRGGAGEKLDPPCLCCLVWNPHGGTIYVRYVEPGQIEWVRPPGRDLERLFFSADVSGYNVTTLPIWLHHIHTGSLTDRYLQLDENGILPGES